MNYLSVRHGCGRVAYGSLAMISYDGLPLAAYCRNPILLIHVLHIVNRVWCEHWVQCSTLVLAGCEWFCVLSVTT